MAGKGHCGVVLALALVLAGCTPPPEATPPEAPARPQLHVEPNPVSRGTDAQMVIVAGSRTLELDDRLGLWRWDDATERWVSILPGNGAATLSITVLAAGGRFSRPFRTSDLAAGRYRVQQYGNAGQALDAEFMVVPAGSTAAGTSARPVV